MSPGTAREHVRVARTLRDLPVIRGEFAAGRLSYAKVRALTRIATPATDGRTTLDHLVSLCRYHHQLVHDRPGRAGAPTGRGGWCSVRVISTGLMRPHAAPRPGSAGLCALRRVA
jgi:hypothetical protein